jgi:hypothetical protein
LKQHLSIEQLSILDFKQQKGIATLFGQYGNCVRNDEEGNEYFNLGLLAERINIGRMIETLCASEFCFPHIGLTESKRRSEWIVVGVTCLSGSEKFKGKTFEADVLCDALWEAVKAVI